MVGQRQRGTKHGHHGVADIFVQSSALRLDDIGAGAQVFIHQHHELGGRKLTDAQILGFCSFLLVAGSGTTTIMLSNLVNRLLSAPGLLETVSTGVPTALATGTLGFATRTDLGKRISAATGGAIDVADLAFVAACAQRLTGAEPDLLRGANDEVIHGMMAVYAFHGGQYLGDAVGGYEARHRPAADAAARAGGGGDGQLTEQAQVSVSVKTRS